MAAVMNDQDKRAVESITREIGRETRCILTSCRKMGNRHGYSRH
ncbi:hypothetical protein IMSAG249_00573 [Lachnospiraceae bacterium]|nr:hypothetical protein IMSAG249_00573 [Lachnospiraceae bacterium]